MAQIIKLTKAINISGEELKEIELDFDSLRGLDLLEAEKEARAAGDESVMLMFSMRYQAAVAAKISVLSYDDVLNLKGNDFTRITNAVATFLMKRG